MPPRRLIFRSFQSPGDIVMLTAAVRDLHLAHRDKFETDVRTSADAIWQNNPYITRLTEGQPGVEQIEMHYPLIHESNQRPYHFLHGYPQYLEQQLNIKIPVTRFAGDIHLSADEKNSPPPGAELGVGEHYLIVIAGGKYDFTAKWWNPASFQKVVDHFRGKIQFVQCGEQGHWHPPLDGVINLVGKTDTRAFIRLVYHADGVVCPVTFAMHLAAAVETKPGRPPNRACVVVAGGREPPQWEAYPQHQYISTSGALSCCSQGGCWKSRCQLVGDGDQKDRHDVCVDPVQIRPDLRIPRCLDLITPEQVIDRIELYYRGGALKYATNGHPKIPPLGRGGQEGSLGVPSRSDDARPVVRADSSPNEAELRNARSQAELGNEVTLNSGEFSYSQSEIPIPKSEMPMNVLINFRHGLGDAIQLTIVLKHLQSYRPNWNVDVAALVGKHSAYRGLCRNIYVLERESPPCCEYGQRFNLDWNECQTAYSDSPSTKAEKCLREEFGISPDPELCSYTMQISAAARELARRYIETVCKVTPGKDDRYPVVLIHYEGNTSAEHKNIPSPVVAQLCNDIIEDGYVPVILDWDYRTALADGVRIHCPDQRAALWHGTGTGDAESLAALTEMASLMIGVDSGPLHVAGATTTPTLGVWTHHHPLHYFSHASNVTHLVPHDHAGMIRGNRETGEEYFSGHYRFQTYHDLQDALCVAVRSRLREQHGEGSLVFTRNFWIRADNGEQDLVIVDDVAERDSYKIDELPMPHPVVVDVGAHIGCFAKKVHQRNPLARIFAVECCPENIPALQKNVEGFATVVQAAMTYEPNVALLNAVYSNCASTGGSTLVGRAELERRVLEQVPALTGGELGGAAPEAEFAPDEADPIRIGEYWADFRPIRTLTLEDLMQEHEFDFIDILKLDCEGSEFSILGKTPSLDRIGLIVGEYHGRERFDQLIADRFAGWNLRILHDGDLGTFWLTNPAYTLPPFGLTNPAYTLPPLGRGGQGGSHCLPAGSNTANDNRITSDQSGDPASVGGFLRNPQPRDEPLNRLTATRKRNTLGNENVGPRKRESVGNGHAPKSQGASFQYNTIYTRSVDGNPISFAEVLRSLRDAAASDQIHLHGFAASPAIRQACDTFTSEHPEFSRRLIENGAGQTLQFERKSSFDSPAG